MPEETGFSTVPILFSAATKRWAVGTPGVYKSVTRLWLGLAGAVTARFRAVLTDDESGLWHTPLLSAVRSCRLRTGLRRVRRVRLCLNGEGVLALTGVEMSGHGVGEVK